MKRNKHGVGGPQDNAHKHVKLKNYSTYVKNEQFPWEKTI